MARTAFFDHLVRLGAATALTFSAVATAQNPAPDFASADASNGIAVFGYSLPARLEIHDANANRWLAPITIPAPVVGVGIDGRRVAVVSSSAAYLVDLDARTVTEVARAEGSSTFRAADVVAGKMFITDGTRLFAHEIPGGRRLAEGSNWYYGFASIAANPAGTRFAYWLPGLSPNDVGWFGFNHATNTFGGGVESPYHGDYPISPMSRFSADGSRLWNGGIAYRADDMVHMGSFGLPVSSVHPVSDGFLVLTQGRLHKATLDARDMGPYGTLGSDIVFAQSAGQEAIAYAVSGPALQVRRAGLNSNGYAPVAPAQVLTSIDFVSKGRGDLVALVSRSQRTAHLWSRRLRKVIARVGLTGEPVAASLRGVDNMLMVAYESGRIAAIPMADGAAETTFASTAVAPGDLVATDNLVFSCDYSGAWASHWVFGPTGAKLNVIEWNHCTGSFEWNATTGRLYQGTAHSPFDIEWEAFDARGAVVATREAPSHGDLIGSRVIRVNPQGTILVTGAGQILDASGLTILRSIPQRPVDVAWVGDGAYFAEGAVVTQMDAGFAAGRTRTFDGNVKRLLADGRVVVVAHASPAGDRVEPMSDSADPDVEIGVTSSIFSGAENAEVEVVVANLDATRSIAYTLQATLPSGLSLGAWRCESGNGASCPAASGSGVPAGATLPARGFLRYTIAVSGTVASGSLPATAEFRAVAAADTHATNNTATLRIERETPIFSNSFE